MDVTVQDNFLLTPELRAWHARSRVFAPVESQGVSFPGIALCQSSGDFPLRQHRTFFRLTTPDMVQPTFIHNDLAASKRTGILYLNHKVVGGTAFWKHKESGLLRAPTHEDLAVLGSGYMAKLIEDGLDESKWEQVSLIEGVFNRYVEFEAGLWHSCYPRGGWGTNAQDGRVIQVYFFT